MDRGRSRPAGASGHGPLPRPVGDGLVLRRGSAADAEPVAELVADLLRLQDAPEPDSRFGTWARDLMSGRHRTFSPGDCLIVSQGRTGRVVASALL